MQEQTTRGKRVGDLHAARGLNYTLLTAAESVWVGSIDVQARCQWHYVHMHFPMSCLGQKKTQLAISMTAFGIT